MASNRNERRTFQTDGPKRRRRTRRELPYGQLRMWGNTVGNFKRERENRLLAIIDREER
jgi:hypothetical protein